MHYIKGFVCPVGIRIKHNNTNKLLLYISFFCLYYYLFFIIIIITYALIPSSDLFRVKLAYKHIRLGISLSVLWKYTDSSRPIIF